MRVYPRPHGEAPPAGRQSGEAEGLSPPTRGSRRGRCSGRRYAGSIPAHTGKPQSALADGPDSRVYPRPHGEALARDVVALAGSGLSPPTRGSRAAGASRTAARRSIPAHTGKPTSTRTVRARLTVYPRPHGEASHVAAGEASPKGLSPPTRGSPPGPRWPRPRGRSIPAHTGKPSWSVRRDSSRRVYPRPHGEANRGPAVRICGDGLSPPTRGSRPLRAHVGDRQGSIPAHTGKPVEARDRAFLRKVYPRPHGEASPRSPTGQGSRGLSPPTRGSLRRSRGHARNSWSIPAHTGKPSPVANASSMSAVYPRPHGEAAASAQTMKSGPGLSPPTRGSRPRSRYGGCPVGSIPAHTGKPSTAPRSAGSPTVYPRPHGEASNGMSARARSSGLSPPTRGSPRDGTRCAARRGSIPAHTGKPGGGPAGRGERGVYPRPHGEAGCAAAAAVLDRGLSPPTRGSPSP